MAIWSHGIPNQIMTEDGKITPVNEAGGNLIYSTAYPKMAWSRFYRLLVKNKSGLQLQPRLM